MRPLTPLAALALALVGPRVALAQDVAAAEALFEKGVADMEAGTYATGCPAIAESQRLDPRPGTLFALATCEDRAGRSATAAARFQDYLDAYDKLAPEQQKKQRERPAEAKARKAALAASAPRLSIALAPGAPKDAVVRRDDAVLGAAALGLPLPTDPGDHVLVAEGGGARAEKKVTLKNGDRVEVTLELRAQATPTPVAQPAPAATPPPTRPEGPAAPPPAPAGSPLRTAGFVLGGVGLVGVALGAVTGGLTLAKKGAITDGCHDHLCTADGKAAADSAQTLGLVSTVGFVAGGAALAAGVVLVLVAPSSAKAPTKTGIAPWVDVAGASGASAGVKGVF
jgi:hypothetical protein